MLTYFTTISGLGSMDDGGYQAGSSSLTGQMIHQATGGGGDPSSQHQRQPLPPVSTTMSALPPHMQA